MTCATSTVQLGGLGGLGYGLGAPGLGYGGLGYPGLGYGGLGGAAGQQQQQQQQGAGGQQQQQQQQNGVGNALGGLAGAGLAGIAGVNSAGLAAGQQQQVRHFAPSLNPVADTSTRNNQFAATATGS